MRSQQRRWPLPGDGPVASAPMSASTSFLLAVPYYSGVDHLRLTLASVLAQDDPCWACVVVDDSPVDHGVGDVVVGLGDPRVTYRRNERNLGVAGAFNRCFELAVESGAPLVSIVHADDLLEPSYVRVARAAHEREPDAACVAPRVVVIGAGGAPSRTVPDTVKSVLRPRLLDRLAGERGLRLLLRGQFFYCPAVSYRVGLLRLPAWNERWGQVMDLELYARVLLDGGTILLDPACTYRYRRHQASATQVNSSTLVRSREETELCRALTLEADDRGWARAARAGRRRLAVRLQALMQAVLAVRRDRELAREALRLSIGR